MAGDLKIDKRRKLILEIINQKGTVKIKDLSTALSVSAVTVRGDLESLEAKGFLKRTAGGAILTIKNSYKIDSINRTQKNYALKKEIAKKIEEIIPDGSILIINSGTTTGLAAEELKKRKRLNVVTNSIEVSLKLGCQPSMRVIMLGGEVNAQYGFVYGSDTLNELKKYKADYAILSVDGISEDNEFTTLHPEEAIIDRAMISRARKVYIVADSTKINHEGFFFVSSFSPTTTLVTDSHIDKDVEQRLKEKGLNIIKA